VNLVFRILIIDGLQSTDDEWNAVQEVAVDATRTTSTTGYDDFVSILGWIGFAQLQN